MYHAYSRVMGNVCLTGGATHSKHSVFLVTLDAREIQFASKHHCSPVPV